MNYDEGAVTFSRPDEVLGTSRRNQGPQHQLEEEAFTKFILTYREAGNEEVIYRCGLLFNHQFIKNLFKNSNLARKCIVSQQI